MKVISYNGIEKKIDKIAELGGFDLDTQEELESFIEKAVFDAEPVKHGHWEMYGAFTQGTLVIPIYRCSECKEDTNNWFWNYCPNCGARMDEVEE